MRPILDADEGQAQSQQSIGEILYSGWPGAVLFRVHSFFAPAPRQFINHSFVSLAFPRALSTRERMHSNPLGPASDSQVQHSWYSGIDEERVAAKVLPALCSCVCRDVAQMVVNYVGFLLAMVDVHEPDGGVCTTARVLGRHEEQGQLMLHTIFDSRATDRWHMAAFGTHTWKFQRVMSVSISRLGTDPSRGPMWFSGINPPVVVWSSHVTHQAWVLASDSSSCACGFQYQLVYLDAERRASSAAPRTFCPCRYTWVGYQQEQHVSLMYS